MLLILCCKRDDDENSDRRYQGSYFRQSYFGRFSFKNNIITLVVAVISERISMFVIRLKRYSLLLSIVLFALALTACGGSGGSGASSTTAADTTPSEFSFTDQTGVTKNTAITSAAITVAGINAAATISVTGGTYQIGSGSFTSTAGTVTNGQTVQVKHTSSNSGGTAVNTTLFIGGVSDIFTSTTTGDTAERAAAIAAAAALQNAENQAQEAALQKFGTGVFGQSTFQ
jgi:hypothetical protein